MFFNPDSGLYLTNYRAYDPAAGRWLSRDPLGESTDSSANLYPYVDGNPVFRFDPLGLAPMAFPQPCNKGTDRYTPVVDRPPEDEEVKPQPMLPKGTPLPSPNFIPPTNPPQEPPTVLPPGHTVRIGDPTEQYPTGYWVQYNEFNQPVDPSTGRPPGNVTRPEGRARVHVPLPSRNP